MTHIVLGDENGEAGVQKIILVSDAGQALRSVA